MAPLPPHIKREIRVGLESRIAHRRLEITRAESHLASLRREQTNDRDRLRSLEKEA